MLGKAVPFWVGAAHSGRTGLELLSPGRAGPRTRVNEAARLAKRPTPQSAVVEVLDCEAAAGFAAEWRDLAARSLEANVFYEPACALAAAQHIAAGRRPHFLFVWEGRTGGRGELLAVCPLQGSGRFAGSLARLWMHKQATLGTPLLDRARAAEALDAILDYCRRAFPGVAGLTFPLLALDGATARLLRARAAAEGRPIRILGRHERAILNHDAGANRFLERSVSPGRLKKLQRARRRLEGVGEVTFRMARDPCDMRLAGEQFLMLEAKGWKGRRGTALLNTPQLATFARTMTRALAKEGKCRIASLDVAGEPIAMLIVLTSGDRAFTWKIAHDEAFAAFSPGVQLMLELTRVQLDDAGIAVTDSCTAANHPMIEHLWPERMAVADVFVGVAAERSKAFAAAFEREALWRKARSRLKDAITGLRGWRKR